LPEITGREFREEDKWELNDSYNRFTSRSRTIEQFEWEWLRTPEGPGNIWVLQDKDTGRVVGCHSLLPIRFSYFGRNILAGKTENSHLHPPYAGRGLYLPLEVKYLKEAGKRFQLLFTVWAVGGHRRTREKLGYATLGINSHYVKATRKQHLDRLVADLIRSRVENKPAAACFLAMHRLATAVLMLGFSRQGPVDRAVRLEKVAGIDAVAEELDRLWERNKDKYGITVDRNARYLRWRVFDNPNLPHEFFLARRDGELVGYAVTRIRAEGEIALGTVVDVIADGGSEVIFSSILSGLTEYFDAAGISIIHFPTLLSDNFLNRVLKQNGFVSLSMLWSLVRGLLGRKQKDAVILAKALDDRLDQARVSDPACWYVTDIFSEGRG